MIWIVKNVVIALCGILAEDAIKKTEALGEYKAEYFQDVDRLDKVTGGVCFVPQSDGMSEFNPGWRADKSNDR